MTVYSQLNHTHDPSARSWVESAQSADCDFPIQNLPWCVQRSELGLQVGVRIGTQHLAVAPLATAGLLAGFEPALFEGPYLSEALLSLSPERRGALREALFALLSSEASAELQAQVSAHLSPIGELTLPIKIGDYTDFYASVHHATNVGMMFRPTNPLLPNYKWLPVGYHGRASSVVVSGTPVKRPSGQKAPTEEGGTPGFGPCALLDYELEVGAVVGRGTALGEPLDIEEAGERLFGLCLLNDWSARDIQKWEYQPLGPFLAKNFLSSVSPYVVTAEALAPFRAPAPARAEGDPAPLPHLYSERDQAEGCFDVTLQVHLSTEAMRAQGLPAHQLSEGSFKEMYWTVAQMLTHHSASGCNLQPGDLLGSGTVSGPERSQRGCLLELTWDGGVGNPLPTTSRSPITLPSGEERRFLLAGDELSLSGRCHAEGARSIGFGSCIGRVLD